MEYILTDIKHIDQAKGIVIVIDVLRAFTTACYLFQNHASKIIPVETIEDAFNYKKKYNSYILLGERHGLPVMGFNYSNSPAEIKNIDFSGKTIVMTTTSGTKGIIHAKQANEIITGSFVNSNAILRYLSKSKTDIISFVCTDSSYYDNEDYLFASYIKSSLEGKPIQFRNIAKYLKNHPCTDGFLAHPLTKWSKSDFHLCMEIDTCNFIIKVNKKGTMFLEKVNII